MPYGVVFTAEAESDLDRLPPLVASHALDQIDHLATDPVQLSRPSGLPYRPGGQGFYCEPYDFEGKRYFVYVQFVYGQDEQSIFIQFIARSTVP